MDEKEKYIPDSNSLEQELYRVRYHQEFTYAVRTTIYVLIAAVALALLIIILLFPVIQTYGTSMEPAVKKDSFVLTARTGSPSRGQILAFYINNKIVIRRVIGLPGDKIEIDDSGNVTVNDTKLKDSDYVSEKSIGNCDLTFPYTVPDNQYFVLADVRTGTTDSRNSLVGCVSQEDIIGVVKCTIWPLKYWGFVH